jgi:hypothetical protein
MSTTAPDQSSIQSILTTIQAILSSLGNNTSNIDTAAVTKGLQSIQAIAQDADEKNKRLLLNQQQVKAMVDNENARIQTNIQRVEDNLTTKKRMVNFNENVRLRTEQYNQMMYTFVFTVVLIIAIIAVNRRLPFLPLFITQGLLAIVGAAGVINIYTIYTNMQARSRMNYNELDLDKPAVETPEQIAQKLAAAKRSGNLLDSIDIGGCIGAACCDSANNIVWNTTSRKCSYQAQFDNMNELPIERLNYKKNFVSPNAASEINAYSKV